jgi:lysophospholipase L1-like esterase
MTTLLLLTLLAQLPNPAQFQLLDQTIAKLQAAQNPQAAKLQTQRQMLWHSQGQNNVPIVFDILRTLEAAQASDAIPAWENHLRGLMEQRERASIGSDRDNLARHRAANASLPPPTKPRIIFHGDSITQGWNLTESFPNQTAFELVNRGISGQITGEMLGRMQADIINLQPTAMILLAGTNDLARGVPISTIQNNLTMIADLAAHHKIQPILCSVLPIHDYNKSLDARWEMSKRRPIESIRALNQWLQSFAKQRGYAYLDYATPMTDAQGFLIKDLAQDGLHPNSKGYQIMAPLALQAIQTALKR